MASTKGTIVYDDTHWVDVASWCRAEKKGKLEIYGYPRSATAGPCRLTFEKAKLRDEFYQAALDAQLALAKK